ncbi:hypothetical protein BKA93DRAFT_788604 [Sparassis latifolia]
MHKPTHSMFRNDISGPDLNTPTATSSSAHLTPMQPDLCSKPPLVWDWDLEHEDRKKEAKADAAIHGVPPFQVDRKLLKDIVHERMSTEVARIHFLGAGTFHKGYLITLADGREVVARVARRFMPRLKTESEVATMKYLREHTSIPVPTVYDYDANPYNRLGGEYILMSKAKGIQLGKVFHSMGHNELIALMENLASLVIPLFAYRFPRIGSLYEGSGPAGPGGGSSMSPTPTATSPTRPCLVGAGNFHLGPIISWPFFGSNRGELLHPQEVNRGPWDSTHAYLLACAEREINGVILENEGKVAPHRLHLDPDEILASRHHQVKGLPGDESDQSDEWDWDESEGEWDGPGDTMYRDYRRMQRSTFLVAHLTEREDRVREEMSRFVHMMERLGVVAHEEGDGGGGEEFSLDCHDLSLENVFVDENDHSKITCVIDWESTTTRPLWACAHVPTFMQSSPFTAKFFRATVEKMATQRRTVVVEGRKMDFGAIATEWLNLESTGARLRMAHRCIEWDGWEEGLVESILGPSDQESDWFRSWEELYAEAHTPIDHANVICSSESSGSPTLNESDEEAQKRITKGDAGANADNDAKKRAHAPMVAKVVAEEKEKEKLLNATGDICGGRGGELGRRLEAWLYIHGNEDGHIDLQRRWEGDEEEG